MYNIYIYSIYLHIYGQNATEKPNDQSRWSRWLDSSAQKRSVTGGAWWGLDGPGWLFNGILMGI